MSNPLLDKEFLYELTLNAQKEKSIKINLLDNNNYIIDTLEGVATDGSVSIDGKSAVRRTCSLTILANDQNIQDKYWIEKNKFALFIGLKNNINENYESTIWFPQGMFLITNFSKSVTNNNITISLQGKDKMCLLDGSLGGVFNSQIDLGVKSIVDDFGNIQNEDIELEEIIRELLHEYAQEPYGNIIINDLPKNGLLQKNYLGKSNLYLLVKPEIKNYDIKKIQPIFFIENSDYPVYIGNVEKKIQEINYLNYSLRIIDHLKMPDLITLTPQSKNQFYVIKYEAGDDVGYQQTNLTYSGDLVASFGSTITSILDKIIQQLGNFEYFYNEYGQFVFQQKKNYIYKDYESDITKNEQIFYNLEPFYFFNFKNTELISNISYTPDVLNLKNDFSIEGKGKSINGNEIQCLYRFALDIKPSTYKPIEVTEEEVIILKQMFPDNYPSADLSKYTQTGDKVYDAKNYDWRELIYQMASDYMKYHIREDWFQNKVAKANPQYPTGLTGYEQYYTDIYSWWRVLYNPNPEMILQNLDDLFVENENGGYKQTGKFEELLKKPDDWGMGWYYYHNLKPLNNIEWPEWVELKYYYKDEDDNYILTIQQPDNWYGDAEDMQEYYFYSSGYKNLYISNQPEFKKGIYKYVGDSAEYNILTNQPDDWGNEEDSSYAKYFEYKNGEYYQLQDWPRKWISNKYYSKYVKLTGWEEWKDNQYYIIGANGIYTQISTKPQNWDEDNFDHTLYYKKYEELKKLSNQPTNWGVKWNKEEEFYYFIQVKNYKRNDFQPDPIWKINTFYLYDEIKNKYNLINTKPDNWDTSYKKYYTVEISYEEVTKDKNTPLLDWRKDKYYEKVQNCFIKINNKPKNWDDLLYYDNYYKTTNQYIQLINTSFWYDIDAILKIKWSPKIFFEIKDASYNGLTEKPNDWDLGEAYLKYYQYRGSSYVQLSNWTSWVSPSENGTLFYKVNKSYEKISSSELKIYSLDKNKEKYLYEKKEDGSWEKIKTKLSFTEDDQIYLLDQNFLAYADTVPRYWSNLVLNTPSFLPFWFDFLDTEQDIGKFAVSILGDKKLAKQENSIKAIYYKKIPEIILKAPDEKLVLESDAYTFIQIPEEKQILFGSSSTGISAIDKGIEYLDNYLLNKNTVNITCLPIYYLQPNRRIYIYDQKSKIAGDYEINTIQIPLSYNGTMSFTASKIISNFIKEEELLEYDPTYLYNYNMDIMENKNNDKLRNKFYEEEENNG